MKIIFKLLNILLVDIIGQLESLYYLKLKAARVGATAEVKVVWVYVTSTVTDTLSSPIGNILAKKKELP